MSDGQKFGPMGVDWEERINYDRMRRERLEKAQDALRNSALDALFVFRTEDTRYLTGYRTHLHPVSMLGNAVVILTPDDDPILYTMDHEWAKGAMTWMDPDHVRPRANFREPSGVRTWVDQASGVLDVEAGSKIGVDIWDPKITRSLNSALPQVEFVDGYDVLCRAKVTKTEDEIKCIKVANAITEAAMDAAIDFLEPGVRENEVLAVAWKKMTDLGSEWTQCANIVCSGPNTAPYRRFTSERIIRKGDLVIIDIGACFNGYWGDFTRTWICGDMEPTEEQKELHQACYDSLFDACARSKPGNTNVDVVEAAEPYILDSLGHGSGVSPWEPPFFSSDSEGSEVTLEEGMQFNLEPYAGTPGVGGIRLENNLVVTDDGPDVYTTYPFDERLLYETHPLDSTTDRVQ